MKSTEASDGAEAPATVAMVASYVGPDPQEVPNG